MQLRQPKAFGVLDHHHGRFRHVHPDLDHGGRDQDIQVGSGERLHHRVLFRAFHSPMHQSDAFPQRVL